MNLIDGFVVEVIKEEVKRSSEMWDIGDLGIDKTHFIYTVKAINIGGEFTTELWFGEPTEIKEGYRFLH